MRIDPRRRARRPVSHRAFAILLAAPLATPASCPQEQSPLTDTERAVHLLSRTTYGVRPGDVEALLRTGVDAWLDRQLHPERIDDGALDARLAAANDSPANDMVGVARTRVPLSDTSMAGRMQREQVMRALRVRVAFAQPFTLVNAKIERAVRSERQLEEVMTDFWFNHFNVYFAKGAVRMAVADYEKSAIRRHVFGRFEDMLRATAQHPAMLIYLDNFLSSAPDPARPELKAGLNENYARELLELHTLGVDGGYTQQDVIEVARAFTGWTVAGTPNALRIPFQQSPLAGSGEFEFQPERHDRGEKVVLGHTLGAGRGMEDGLDVLRLLAAHPSTARFIATKLVRHFVADVPPPELVESIADVFTKTNGDLREVTRALFTAERFYDRANYRTKTKRPFEFVASALRVTGAEPAGDRELYNQLRGFGHAPYNEAAPTGFPTEASEWLSAGAVLGRINFALDLAAGRLRGVETNLEATPGDVALIAERRSDESRPAAAAGAAPPDVYERVTRPILERYLYGVRTDVLGAAIGADLAASGLTDPRAVRARAVGLVLGSPEFQKY